MEKIPYYNPATNEVLGHITPLTRSEVEVKFSKAKSAFASWSRTSLAERLAHLKKGRLWLSQNIDIVVDAISLNNGKPKMEALSSDVGPVIQSFKYVEDTAEHAFRDEPISVWKTLPTKRAYMTYSPLGVIGIISPWNYPLSLALGEVIGALAAGNCVILKPSEVTSFVNKKIQDILTACQLPEGVFQMIEGGAETGAALTSCALDKIIFTGSVATGKKVMTTAAQNLVPVSLELGGKDPAIILDDANLDAASSGVLAGGFYNNGQTCASIERLLVHKKIEKEFIELLTKKSQQLRMGPSTGYDNDIGPITYAPQKQTIKKQLDAYSGGSQIYDGHNPFMKPTVIKTKESDVIWNEETFGPVISYDVFETDDEAINMANKNIYGLGSVVWGSTTRARKVARQLQAGTVVINDAPFTNALPSLPWGGTKFSGIGRVHGIEGLRDLCLKRVVVYDFQGQARQFWWFPYSFDQYQAMKAFILLIPEKNFFKRFLTYLNF